MKQTAIEWLEDKYKKLHIPIPKALFDHAKVMEKEQIVDAFSEGTKMIDVNDEMSAIFNGIIYYGENYEQR